MAQRPRHEPGRDAASLFWRTAAGVEVDSVVETGGKPILVEVKLSSTPLPGMAASIPTLRADLGRAAGPGFVVHGGDPRLPLTPAVMAIPFGQLWG